MWFTRAIHVLGDRPAWTAAPAAVATAWLANNTTSSSSPSSSQVFRKRHRHLSSFLNVSQCEGSVNNDDDDNSDDKKIRKRATVKKASSTWINLSSPAAAVVTTTNKRSNTRDELSKIRCVQEEMLQRWEQDEDGWRELPARAWPEYQPNPEQCKGIQADAAKHQCHQKLQIPQKQICQSLLFQIATTLVFYSVDPVAGFQQYRDLAEYHDHVDSMVACGVILVEGLGGIRGREQEGIQWLQKAVSSSSSGSRQALYELGTVYYTGIDNVIDEDPEQAYHLFEQAAAKGHVGAMYMTADCLLEGEGTQRDMARAIPLLYQAADQGHRYARQRVRELLNDKAYHQSST